MSKIAKHQRRAARQWWRRWRERVSEASPGWLRAALGPVVNYADMLLVDHGIFRLVYLNRHRLGERAWRSAQPAPHQVRRIAASGVRTIVNLRGERWCGSYWLERRACARHGIELVNYQVRSRAAPTKEEIFGARDLFHRIEYPMLLHCKSGADRAGLMSVLYLVTMEGQSVEAARQQLALRFGHIRSADTGILDFFFECYLAENARRPVSFFDWVEHIYDPVATKQAFTARGWANVLTNKVLRRE